MGMRPDGSFSGGSQTKVGDIHMNLKSILSATALTATAAFAQDLTPQQLKSACETAAGNTVVFNGPVKVSNFSSRVNVRTGCRIVFGATGRLEADSINMGFAGPLSFQGGVTSGVVLTKALLEARTITVDLTGGDNEVNLAESTIRATAGGISVQEGAASKLTVSSQFAGRTQAMQATAAIQITGGDKFDATVDGTSLVAPAGITMIGGGDELTLSLTNTNLTAASGAVNIASSGRQASVTYVFGQIRTGTGISVNLSGNEGQIALQQVTANAGSGSASFVTALSGARPAKSIVKESSITAGGGVSVVAAETGESGEAELETSTVRAGADVIVRSGPRGTTNAKLNSLQSPSLVGVYTGPSGSCLAEGNAVVAPVQALCLP